MEPAGDAAAGEWSLPFDTTVAPLPAERQPLGSWRAELLAFGAAVRAAVAVAGGGVGAAAEAPLTSGADGLATVAAMAAVLEAVESGGEVKPSFTLE